MTGNVVREAVAGTAGSPRRRWVALLLAACSLISLVALPQAASAAVADRSLGYNTVGPARILDTRSGLGARKAALGAGKTLTLQVTGTAGVPRSGVSAVALNVTAVSGTVASALTVYPAGSTRPGIGNLYFPASVAVSNQVIAQVGSTGAVTIYNSKGSVQVTADVSGWYDTGSYYAPTKQTRILDTRIGLGATKAALGAAKTLTLQVSGVAGVPASGAVAVALNLSGIGPTAATTITAYPSGVSRPGTVDLSLVKARTGAGLVIGKLGTGGKVVLYNSAGSLNLTADVQGWYAAGGQYTPIAPTRILDTRTTKAPIGAETNVQVKVTGCCPGGTTDGYAAVVSLTAISPRAAGTLSLGPGTSTRTTFLTFAAGQTTTDLAIVPLVGGYFDLANNSAAATNVSVDVLGVMNSPTALENAPATGPVGTVGTPYRQVFVGYGGNNVYSWSVHSGALPAGLTLRALGGEYPMDGVLSGTPTAAGTSTAVLRVSDGNGLAADHQITIAIQPFVSRAAWAWGQGTGGQLGDGVVGSLTAPMVGQVGSLSGVSDVIADGSGAYTSGACALLADTSVDCWGANANGLLGNGSTVTSSLTPVPVTGLTGVLALAGRAGTNYALKSDGTVWGWGLATNGKATDLSTGNLGSTGGTASHPTPIQVAGLSGVTAICAAASGGGYAVKSDGTVWGWGPVLLGGASEPSVAGTPVQIPGLTEVTQVAGTTGSSFALESDGTVWAWGSNTSGQLGDGTTTDHAAPAQIPALAQVAAVTTAWTSSTVFAVTSAGTLLAWGSNQFGQLGNGATSTIPITTPTAVPGLSGVTAVASEARSTFALTSDHKVWSWGIPAGVDGLGSALGSTQSRYTPGLAEYIPPSTRIAAGSGSAFAIGLP